MEPCAATVRTAPIDVLVPRAMWNSAKVLDISCFWFAQAERDDWNNWNFGTLGTCGSLKRFERSEAVEPFDKTQGRLLERLERTDPGGFVLAGIKPGLILLNSSILRTPETEKTKRFFSTSALLA